MSLVHVFVPASAKVDAEMIIGHLTDALLRAHGAEGNETARGFTWVLVHQLADGHWGVGGRCDPKLLSLTVVSEPAGSLDDEKRGAIAREVHSVWEALLGSKLPGTDVWIVIQEIPDGCWCADGRVHHLRDIEILLDLDSSSDYGDGDERPTHDVRRSNGAQESRRSSKPPGVAGGTC